MPRQSCFVVIMAGGQGTRFWPRSRRREPKQLLSIAGSHTMLQETAHRLRGLCRPENVLVITSVEHVRAVRRQLPEIPAGNVVAEPVGRNTAPCIALAAEIVRARSANATLVVLPADHAIRDVPAFRAALRRAIDVARRQRCLVTLGVQPTYPETGYGYIEIGARFERSKRPAAYWVGAFREKPDRVRAAEFVASGRYLWNAGMFVFHADVIRDEIARRLPRIAAALAPLGEAKTSRQRAVRLQRAYGQIDSVSIDVGVMERAERVAVVETNFGWNDVGSWAAMPALWGEDAHGNAVRGTVLALDSSESIVFSPKRAVALLGVRDLVVVDSDDALLVCHRDRAQDVRLVVEELQRRRLRRLL